MDGDLSTAVDRYLDYIRTSYINWNDRPNRYEKVNEEIARNVRIQMNTEFVNSVVADEGRKYVRILANGSAHSFIVKVDTGKFKRGDILKAASWAAPATNFPRGNVFDDSYPRVQWNGAI